MGTINVEGLGPVQIKDDIPNQEEARNILRAQLSLLGAQEGFLRIADTKRGAPASVRRLVGGARTDEDRLANIRQVFPEAIPFDDDNFIFLDRETNRPTLYNPPGLDFGDVSSAVPEIAEGLGGVMGGAVAAPAALAGSVPTGGASLLAIPAGVGLGAAAGRELVDVTQEAFGGRIDTRGIPERLTDVASTAALNAAGQRVGDIAIEGVKSAARGALKGRAVAPVATLSDFDRAAVNPRSGAAVTGSRGLGVMEQGLSGLVAGGDVFAQRARSTLSEVSKRVTELADELSPVRARVQAGAQLKRGGKEFIEGFEAEARSLEREFAKKLPAAIAEAPAPLNNTVAALQGVGERFPTNPELGKSLVDPQFQKWLDLLGQSNGQLTFKELREFRSFIGRKLSRPVIVEDIPRADLERLYGAMSDDLRSIAQAGGDDALNAFNKATRFERQGFNRIRDSLQEIASPDSKVSAERVFGIIDNLASERGKTANLRKLAQIRRSVSPEQWRAVGSVVLRKMGSAPAGVQGATEVGETGAEFSVARFLTEWNKISPEARNLLFKGVVDDGWVSSVNSLVRVAGALKDVDALANTSGTARVLQAMGLTTAAGGVVGAVATGNIVGGATGAAALLAGRIVAPQVAARLLTNTKFVRWLARAGSISLRNPNSMPKHLARLAFVAKTEPTIREEIRQYVDALRDVPSGSAPVSGAQTAPGIPARP